MEAGNNVEQVIRKSATDQGYEALKNRLRWRIRCAQRRLKTKAGIELSPLPATRR